METKGNAEPVDRPAGEYRTPELTVHGDVTSLTAGSYTGSSDIGAQTSALPGDTGT